MNKTIERIRAVLRLLGSEEITPTGRRMIELVLDDEEQQARHPEARKITPDELEQWMREVGIPPIGEYGDD